MVSRPGTVAATGVSCAGRSSRAAVSARMGAMSTVPPSCAAARWAVAAAKASSAAEGWARRVGLSGRGARGIGAARPCGELGRRCFAAYPNPREIFKNVFARRPGQPTRKSEAGLARPNRRHSALHGGVRVRSGGLRSGGLHRATSSDSSRRGQARSHLLTVDFSVLAHIWKRSRQSGQAEDRGVAPTAMHRRPGAPPMTGMIDRRSCEQTQNPQDELLRADMRPAGVRHEDRVRSGSPVGNRRMARETC